MATLCILESAEVRVEIDPAYGARVLSLLDKRSGRDWMAKGPQSTQVGEGAVYLADEAVGWDECFPTVAPWDATATALGRRLRDHGDLWGRPWSVDAQAGDSVTTSWSDGAFRFTRLLSLAGATLTVSYAVTNLAAEPLPFMWALHGLLAVTPDDRIRMDGVDHVAASYIARDGETIVAPSLPWARAATPVDVALDAVLPADAHFAAKLYASNVPAARVSVGGANGRLTFAWDNSELRHLGLWLNYGGWPSPGAVHHLALEPTTAPVDHLGQALQGGTAITLPPGTTSRWVIALTLDAPALSTT
jgi:galactose mutarotase-like enzyme